MNGQTGAPAVRFYLLLIALSLLAGCLVPWFYEWTGSDQSRMSPSVGWTAIALCAVAGGVCAALPWTPIAAPAPSSDARPRFRFTVKMLLIVTAAVAVIVATGVRFPWVASGLLAVLAYGYAAWVGGRSRACRWPIVALVACLQLPFAWVCFYDELEQILPAILWIAAGAPMLFPAAVLGGLFGQGMNDAPWLAVLLTAVELSLGVWLIQRGPRRGIAYLVLVLLASTFGSFVLNALVRA